MLKIKQLKGIKKYKDINEKMDKQVSIVSKNINCEQVWFLEHEKIFTAGSSTPKDLKKTSINNIPLINVSRGGKVTYHGPGQLIIYPILNIKKRRMNIIEYILIYEFKKTIKSVKKKKNIFRYYPKENI